MSPRAFLCLFIAEISAAACTQPRAAEGADRAEIQAHGVKVEIANPDGRIELTGDELSMEDAGAVIRLSGNTAVRMEGKSALEARSADIRLEKKGSKIELTGDVRARFRIPAEGRIDAGM